MPSIHITCPKCARLLEIDTDMVDQEVECGACTEVFVAKSSPKSSSDGKPWESKAGKASKRKSSRRRLDDDDDDDDGDYVPRRLRRERRGRYPDQKSRLAYILLALFLGNLGIHNFYIGRTGAGLAQLLITAVSIPLMCIVVGFFTVWIPWIWAIIDIIQIERDADDVPLAT